MPKVTPRERAGPGRRPGSGRRSPRRRAPGRARAPSLHRRGAGLSLPPVSSMMCQLSVVESKSATFPSEKARHLLDDSVLESRSPRRGLALTSSSAVTNGLSLGKRVRPARRSRGPRPGRVLVSVCRCAESGGPSAPAAVAGARKAPPSRPPRLHKGPWACPHPAGGPEHGRQGEGAARHTPETRCRGLATVKPWLLPPQDFCPWGSRRPQQAGQSWGSHPRAAADGPPGSHVCPCRHTEESVREDEKVIFRDEAAHLSFSRKGCSRQQKGQKQSRGRDRAGARSEQSSAEPWPQLRPPGAPRLPVVTAPRQAHSPLAMPFPHACASVVLVSVCLSASLHWQLSWGPCWV